MSVAYFMLYDTPIIRLHIEGDRLVGKENLVPEISGRPDLTFPLLLTTSELEHYLLSRRISTGRTDRNNKYFEGMTLSPMKELLYHRGADMDDNCWIKFEGESISFKDVFKDELPVGYRYDRGY